MREKPQEHLGFKEMYDFMSHELTAASSGHLTPNEQLARSIDFMKRLDDPQESLKIIHIAGTSGKGTVAYMLNALLRAHKKSVGLHVSPHVYDLRERFQTDGKLTDKNICTATFNTILPKIYAMDNSDYGRPTYFEVTMGMAFTIFNDAKVDYAIIETGLGGLYDASNTIKRSDKLAVITTLGYDHTEILGETLEEIAAQKAGIFPLGGHAIVQTVPTQSVQRVMDTIAKQMNTGIEYITSSNAVVGTVSKQLQKFNYLGERTINDIELSLVGKHQVSNATLAIRVLEYLAQRDNFTFNPVVVRKALRNLSIPGRYQVTDRGGATVIFDGAHNVQKMSALTQALAASGHAPAIWVLAFKQGKNIHEILSVLRPYQEQVIFTDFATSQYGNGPKAAIDPAMLAEIAKQVGIVHYTSLLDREEALRQAIALAKVNKLPVIVAGSFYLVGDLGPEFAFEGVTR